MGQETIEGLRKKSQRKRNVWKPSPYFQGPWESGPLAPNPKHAFVGV